MRIAPVLLCKCLGTSYLPTVATPFVRLLITIEFLGPKPISDLYLSCVDTVTSRVPVLHAEHIASTAVPYLLLTAVSLFSLASRKRDVEHPVNRPCRLARYTLCAIESGTDQPLEFWCQAGSGTPLA